jgi:hypothetical protein
VHTKKDYGVAPSHPFFCDTFMVHFLFDLSFFPITFLVRATPYMNDQYTFECTHNSMNQHDKKTISMFLIVYQDVQ